MAAVMEMSLDNFARFLEERAAKLSRIDLSQPMRVLLVLAKANVKEHFATGTAPDGTVWQPLKRPRQGKRHKNSSPLPLRDTGLLMASVTSAGPHHVERLTDSSMEVGTNLEYAGIHQYGGTVHHPERSRNKPWVFTNDSGDTVFTRKVKAHDVTIPARPFLGWSERLIKQCADVLGEVLEKEIWP